MALRFFPQSMRSPFPRSWRDLSLARHTDPSTWRPPAATQHLDLFFAGAGCPGNRELFSLRASGRRRAGRGFFDARLRTFVGLFSGIGFMFAPLHHPSSIKNVGTTRFFPRTIFNSARAPFRSAQADFFCAKGIEPFSCVLNGLRNRLFIPGSDGLEETLFPTLCGLSSFPQLHDTPS